MKSGYRTLETIAHLFQMLLALAAIPVLCVSAKAGYFTNAGSMNFPRGGHTATLLPSGMVLVTGGADNNGYISDSEVYDPASRVWTSVGSLSFLRGEHTATLLPDGRVLVVGGVNEAIAPPIAEVFDPNTGTWTNTGALTEARMSHTASLLPNGNVIVVGGLSDNGYLPSTELYDPIQGTWVTNTPMAVGRHHHTATLLPNGKLLVVGGNGDFPSYLISAELYDPTNRTWTQTGSLIDMREEHTATLLPNGKVLVTGGSGNLSSSELYDPVSGVWTLTGSMMIARESHKATLLPNGKVLVVGGYVQMTPFTIHASAEIYDPATELWTATGSMMTGRGGHEITQLTNGNVLVSGGAPFQFSLVSMSELFTDVPPFTIDSQEVLPSGAFQLRFQSVPRGNFSVLAAANFTLPISNWAVLGSTKEIFLFPGQFQFTDSQATNHPQRFYRVRAN